MVNSAPPYFFGNNGKSQPFAPNFSARPRRNLYSSSSSRVDQEADQRKCSCPFISSANQAATSLRNSTTCGGSAETLKSISCSFSDRPQSPTCFVALARLAPTYHQVRLRSPNIARLASGRFLTGLFIISFNFYFRFFKLLLSSAIPVSFLCRNPAFLKFPRSAHQATVPGEQTLAVYPTY